MASWGYLSISVYHPNCVFTRRVLLSLPTGKPRETQRHGERQCRVVERWAAPSGLIIPRGPAAAVCGSMLRTQARRLGCVILLNSDKPEETRPSFAMLRVRPYLLRRAESKSYDMGAVGRVPTADPFRRCDEIGRYPPTISAFIENRNRYSKRKPALTSGWRTDPANGARPNAPTICCSVAMIRRRLGRCIQVPPADR